MCRIEGETEVKGQGDRDTGARREVECAIYGRRDACYEVVGKSVWAGMRDARLERGSWVMEGGGTELVGEQGGGIRKGGVGKE